VRFALREVWAESFPGNWQVLTMRMRNYCLLTFLCLKILGFHKIYCFFFVLIFRSLSSLCASLKLACELYPSRHVALCLDPYCGLGFSMWTLISVYSGHHSILIAPYEVKDGFFVAFSLIPIRVHFY
jgi:hypothetical protein